MEAMKWRQLNFLNFNKKGDNTSGVTTDAISCKETLRTKKNLWCPTLGATFREHSWKRRNGVRYYVCMFLIKEIEAPHRTPRRIPFAV